MNKYAETLMNAGIEYFSDYNKKYDEDPIIHYSEATKYNLDAMKKWIKIRKDYTFVDDYCDGEWEYFDMMQFHKKYGYNYIYIEPNKKLWRLSETPSEFYGYRGNAFQG